MASQMVCVKFCVRGAFLKTKPEIIKNYALKSDVVVLWKIVIRIR